MFNCPVGLNAARVDFAVPTVEDSGYKFKFGVIKKTESNKIYGPNIWLSYKELLDVQPFNVNIGDVLIFQRKAFKTNNVQKMKINIKEEWPNSAVNNAMVHVPYYWANKSL